MRPKLGRISAHIKSRKFNVTNLILKMRSCCSKIIAGNAKCHVPSEICQNTLEERKVALWVFGYLCLQ